MCYTRKLNDDLHLWKILMKILNAVLVSQIQQYIERIINQYQVDLFQESAT
jgi:hypothetical protein